MGSDLQLQFCPECFPLFKASEELLKNAHDNRIHADSLFLRPLLKSLSGFSSDVKKLRVREWQARFAGLGNLRLFSVDVRESKQYYSRQIALDAGFFCHCLAEFNGKSECDSGTVFGPSLTLAIDLPGCFLCCQRAPLLQATPRFIVMRASANMDLNRMSFSTTLLADSLFDPSGCRPGPEIYSLLLPFEGI
jgi:hypothetical protein